MLVTSVDPLRVLVYREGLVRLCTSKYTAPTNANVHDLFMHLTNYSINKYNDNFIQNNTKDGGGGGGGGRDEEGTGDKCFNYNEGWNDSKDNISDYDKHIDNYNNSNGNSNNNNYINSSRRHTIPSMAYTEGSQYGKINGSKNIDKENKKEKEKEKENEMENKKESEKEMANENEDGCSKRSLSWLWSWLDKSGINSNEIWRKICDIIVKTLLSTQPFLERSVSTCKGASFSDDIIAIEKNEMRNANNHTDSNSDGNSNNSENSRNNTTNDESSQSPTSRTSSPTPIQNCKNNNPFQCFELLGFDIILTDLFSPILLEVNHTPSFKLDSPLDKRIKTNLIKNTLQLLNINPESKRKYYKRTAALAQFRLYGSTFDEKNTGNIEREESYENIWHMYKCNEEKHIGDFDLVYPTDDYLNQPTSGNVTLSNLNHFYFKFKVENVSYLIFLLWLSSC